MSVAAHAENHVEQYWHHVKHMRPDIVCPAGLFCLAQLSQPSQLESCSSKSGRGCHVLVIVN